MKHLFLFLSIALTINSYAQDKSVVFGVKAGLNYGDNGSIEIADITNAGQNLLSEDASDRVGYHLGIFLRKRLTDNLYLRPELQYTKNSSSFDIASDELTYDVQKIDAPILLGAFIFKPIHIFGGPSLQYLIENDLEDVRLGDVKNEFTVGVQFGVGVKLGRINADVRYERGLSENQAQNIDDTIGQTIRVDSRPNQLILSVSLDL